MHKKPVSSLKALIQKKKIVWKQLDRLMSFKENRPRPALIGGPKNQQALQLGHFYDFAFYPFQSFLIANYYEIYVWLWLGRIKLWDIFYYMNIMDKLTILFRWFGQTYLSFRKAMQRIVTVPLSRQIIDLRRHFKLGIASHTLSLWKYKKKKFLWLTNRPSPEISKP